MANLKAQFGVAASEEGSAFVAYAGPALADTLCVQEDRRVRRDNWVSLHGRALQIPQQGHRRHYVRATVSVRGSPDASPADPVTQEAA